MKKKLAVAFLWHMHQPLYKDLLTGKYHLPWVRLHATHAYLDMASILDDFPEVKCTFNFTPSLMYQLLDIAADKGVDDVYFRLSLKNAADLTNEDKYFILRNFFSCNPSTAIFPIKRYKELFSIRGDSLRKTKIRQRIKDFSVSDYRDIQVFFNLAWCGFTLRRKDPLVRALLAKGSGYTEEEKTQLLNRQKEVVASILPMYRKLQDEGRIEISTTPFYHPILPLLCQGKPGQGFDLREDAGWHVKRAVSFYREVFGRKPLGMWPAEGSVSDEVISVFAAEGIKWIATDEGILLESFKNTRLGRDDLVFSPFTATRGFRSISMVFRDVNLSNAISFRYAHMPPKQASRDFFNDIMGIRAATAGRKGDHVVSVILDGENPWAYYRDGGRGFLSGIYRRLSLSGETELVTLGDYLRTHGKKRIKRLKSGSWINRDFSKWIGSPQKNRAWELLKKTREDMFASGRPDKAALEELYIAESSDWFWWYDEFGTELNFIFDDLFRMHLANIYRIMKKEVPDYLKVPICGKKTGSADARPGPGAGPAPHEMA